MLTQRELDLLALEAQAKIENELLEFYAGFEGARGIQEDSFIDEQPQEVPGEPPY